MRQMMPTMIGRDGNISHFQSRRRKRDAAFGCDVGGVFTPFVLDRSNADDLFVFPDNYERRRTR
jgi:hypothetical protein